MDTERTILFHRGDFMHAADIMGCQYNELNERATFRVFAPNADEVTVVGDFNKFDREKAVPLRKLSSGIFEGEVVSAKEFGRYFYRLHTTKGWIERSDPYAPARNRDGYGLIYNRRRIAADAESHISYIERNRERAGAMSVYTVHVGSWRKNSDGTAYTYARFAQEAVSYLSEMGYTHVHFVGLTGEHLTADGRVGGGYFSPDPRHGGPRDFCRLVDVMHKSGIGVIIDFPAASFIAEGSGLDLYDGTPLYGTVASKTERSPFAFTRGEVQSFVLSALKVWLTKYLVDGVCFVGAAGLFDDPTSDILPGMVKKLKLLAKHAFFFCDDENAAPLRSDDPEDSAVLDYRFSSSVVRDAFSEVIPASLSHVKDTEMSFMGRRLAVDGQSVLPIYFENGEFSASIAAQIPGDERKRFDKLRCVLMYIYAHPGKKLMFMGNEFGQTTPFTGEGMPEWQLLRSPVYQSFCDFVKTLNKLYTAPGMFLSNDSEIRWISAGDEKSGVYALKHKYGEFDELVCLFNLSGIEIKNYRIGVHRGEYVPLLTTGAGGYKQKGKSYRTAKKSCSGYRESLTLTLPPYSGMYLIKRFLEDK